MGTVQLNTNMESTLAADLAERLTEELYVRSKAAVLALAVVLAMVYVILGPLMHRLPALPWIFLGLGLVSLLRLILTFRLKQLRDRGLSMGQLRVVFLGGAGLTSLGLAALNVVALPNMTLAQVGLLAICQTGIMSGAAITMAPNFGTYLVYLLPNLGSLAIMSALYPQPDFGAMFVLLICVYIVSLVVVGHHAHVSFRESILLTLKLRDSAYHDNLTGLRNRRALTEFMTMEADLAVRSWMRPTGPQFSIGLLMLDLDHFKRVNDVHGHGAGDAVLQQLARVIEACGRSSDLVARWGGEEFVIMARGTDRDPPVRLAERIRERVAAHDFLLPSGQHLHLTCSIGYALFPFLVERPAAVGWEQVLDIADAALYRAKEGGRNLSVGILPKANEPGGPNEYPAVLAAELKSGNVEHLILTTLGGPTLPASGF